MEPSRFIWGHRRRTNSLFRRLTPWLVVALLLQSFSFPLAALAADDQAVASLEAKLDQKGTIILRDATLAGFSMGGGEVARYLGRYGSDRVSKAMLLGAVTPLLLKTPDNPDGVDKSVFDGMLDNVKKDRLAFLAEFFPNFYNYEPGTKGVSADLIPFSKWVAWAASPLATQQCIVAFGTTDFRADLKKITVPTLIAHGDADRIVPFDISGKKSHEMIKGSRLEVLKGAPHGFAATHAQQLNTLMLDFLRA